MRAIRGLSVLLFLGAALSCQNYGGATGPSGGGGPPGGGGGGVGVQVGDNRYTPSAVTVSAGQTITWTWQGSNAHSVTFISGPSSATQTTGTFQASFSTPGTYAYACAVHGLSMAGVVTVQ